MQVIHDEDGNPITGIKAIVEQQRRRQQKVKDILGKGRDLKDTTRENFTDYASRDLMIKRTMHQWSPWAISGALLTIAATNTIAANLTGDPLTTGTYTLGAAVTVLGVAVAAIKARHRWVSKLVPTTPTQRRWMAIVTGTAMVWLTLAVVVGLNIDTTLPVFGVTLMVATIILARKHWETHHIPDPSTKPTELPPDVVLQITADPEEPEETPEEEHEVPPRAQVYIDRWERSVTNQGQAIPDSHLEFHEMIMGGEGEDGKPIEIGMRYLLHLPETGVTFSGVLASMPRLEMALHRYAKDLSVEQIAPGEGVEADPTIVVFEVIDQSPIEKTVPMVESRYRYETDEDGNVTDGWIECGPYANGDGNAIWRVYTGGDSMWGGFILGGTGSGKSVLLDMIAFSLAASEHTVLWYADGQGGASSPFIPEVADWCTYDEAGWDDLLTALERVCAARAAENKKMMKLDPSKRGFTPTPDRPGITVIIDECQLVIDVSTAQRWEALSRIARKVGVALILATQAAQQESFGRSTTLRDQLIAGNTMVLRTTGLTQQGFIPGLIMDPTQLPPIPGYGYTVAVGGFGRTAPFRSVFCPNYPALWRAHSYNAAGLDALADGAANLATDNRYNKRNDITDEEIIEELDDQLDAIKAAAGGNAPADGQNDTTIGQNTREATHDEFEATPEFAKIAQEIEDTSGHSELDSLLAEFESQIKEADEKADTDDAPQAPIGMHDVLTRLGDAQQQAFDYCIEQTRDDSLISPGAMAEACGWSRQRAHTLIVDLSKAGLLSKSGRGVYALTEVAHDHLFTPA